MAAASSMGWALGTALCRSGSPNSTRSKAKGGTQDGRGLSACLALSPRALDARRRLPACTETLLSREPAPAVPSSLIIGRRRGTLLAVGLRRPIELWASALSPEWVSAWTLLGGALLARIPKWRLARKHFAEACKHLIAQ